MKIRNRIATKAAKKALRSDVIPEPALAAASAAMLEAVDRAVTKRWQRALDLAARTHGTAEQRVAEVYAIFRRELIAAGAAAGATAAAPGIGTAAAASWLTVELGWFALRSTDLIMTLAAIHGHTNSTVEQRRSWVLAILAFGDEASTEFANIVDRVNLNPNGATGMKMPIEVMEQINATLGASLVTKYGTRRGMMAVGRLLPFGIGAVVGGGANYSMIRALAHHADQFFRTAPLGEFEFSEVDGERQIIDATIVDSAAPVEPTPRGELPAGAWSDPQNPPPVAERQGRRWGRRRA